MSAPLILLDSIASITMAAAGAVVVTGSHGGKAAAEFALAVPLRGLIFNDAGGGKDGAGLYALGAFERAGIPAAGVAHVSARIGEALETLEHGVISAENRPAAALGITPGMRAADAAALLRERWGASNHD